MDIEDKSPDKYKIGAMPLNYRLAGAEGNEDELKVFIDEDVLFKIDAYLASDINKELGGVFVGNAYKDGGRKFILIDGYIHAEHTTASVSRLTFTHETWEYINGRIDNEFSGKMILGWYHSHPGHTVFMSAHDTFIQENFFNMDFMTAYIYDPTINERGFFIWKEERTIKAKGYYLVSGDSTPPAMQDNLKKKIEEPPFSDEPYNNMKPEEGKNSLKDIMLFILLGINLIATAFLLINYLSMERERAKADEVNKELAELRADYKALNQKLENYIIENELSKTDTVTSAPEMITYVVNDGDTFEKIALKFFNDAAKKDTIMEVNKMQRDADITKGKIIFIPLVK